MEETSQNVHIIAVYNVNQIPRYRNQAGDNIVCWHTGVVAFSGSGESARQGQGKELAIRAERAPSSVRFKWADKNTIGEKALTNSRFEGAS